MQVIRSMKKQLKKQGLMFSLSQSKFPKLKKDQNEVKFASWGNRPLSHMYSVCRILYFVFCILSHSQQGDWEGQVSTVKRTMLEIKRFELEFFLNLFKGIVA